MIYNLVDQAVDLSHSKFHQTNLELVRETLVNNKYPSDLINRHINIRMSKKSNDNTKNQDNNPEIENITEPVVFASFPYSKCVCSKISQCLRKYNIKSCFHNDNKLIKYFDKQKDKEQLGNRSNIVYKIPCMDCDMVYIGQTKRYLSKRLYEHKYNIRQEPERHTALTKHATTFNHRINYEETSVIRSVPNYKKRLTSEMIQIQRTNNTMNERTDVEKLSLIFKRLLSK